MDVVSVRNRNDKGRLQQYRELGMSDFVHLAARHVNGERPEWLRMQQIFESLAHHAPARIFAVKSSTPRGLELVSASPIGNSKLGQTACRSAAQSGAVAGETALGGLTAQALAAALFALSPEDRARLARIILADADSNAQNAPERHLGQCNDGNADNGRGEYTLDGK